MAEQRKFTFELLTGDIISRPVHAKVGTPLLDANTRLNQEHLAKLEHWKIESVWVRVDEEETRAAETAPVEVDPQPVLVVGSLEHEEPIAWEEISRTAPPMTRTAEEIEAMIADGPAEPEQVVRKMNDTEQFVYDKAEIQEAKKIIDEIHRAAVHETKKAISGIARRHDSNLDDLRRTITMLVDNGISNKQVLGALASLSTYNDYLLAHSVTSTVYAILTGYILGLDHAELYELAEGCLLHDVGMSRINPEIWKKTSRLSLEEHLEVQKHTIYGADVLHEVKGLSYPAKVIAYQHHERHDGSGYPKGRSGMRIHEFARIVAVVDTYAAMTSPRPHRDRLLGYDAMKYILAASNASYDAAIVRAFLKGMALYPIGSRVELSNGTIAFVVSSNPAAPFRPHVKVMVDEAGRNTGQDGDIIDLMRVKDIGINKQLVDTQEDRVELWKAF